MLSAVWAAAAGLVCGVLSGWGIGGGSLLMVWMTAVLSMDQRAAQSVNLLYFLPAAATALPSHFKNGYVDKQTAVPAILFGLAGTALAAWLATALNVALLRRFFGAYLIYIGIHELLRKTPASSQ